MFADKKYMDIIMMMTAILIMIVNFVHCFSDWLACLLDNVPSLSEGGTRKG